MSDFVNSVVLAVCMFVGGMALHSLWAHWCLRRQGYR